MRRKKEKSGILTQKRPKMYKGGMLYLYKLFDIEKILKTPTKNVVRHISHHLIPFEPEQPLQNVKKSHYLEYLLFASHN